MSKKHYEAIARIIHNNTTLDSKGEEDIVQRDTLLGDLIDFFRKDNPNFDANRFLDACIDNA